MTFDDNYNHRYYPLDDTECHIQYSEHCKQKHVYFLFSTFLLNIIKRSNLGTTVLQFFYKMIVVIFGQ